MKQEHEPRSGWKGEKGAKGVKPSRETWKSEDKEKQTAKPPPGKKWTGHLDLLHPCGTVEPLCGLAKATA